MALKDDKRQLTPEAAVDRLEAIYAASCAALSRALDRYLASGTPPTPEERAAFRYPLLRVVCPRSAPPPALAVRSPSSSSPASTKRR
jgi:hypothetical protein